MGGITVAKEKTPFRVVFAAGIGSILVCCGQIAGNSYLFVWVRASPEQSVFQSADRSCIAGNHLWVAGVERSADAGTAAGDRI